MKTRGLSFLVAVLMSASASSADPSPRERIQAQYSKAAAAASLKYVDGIFSVRSDAYVGYTPTGEKFDWNSQRMALQAMLAPCLMVEETTRIESFHQDSANRVRCRVTDVLELVQADPKTKIPMRYRLESTCDDVWQLERGGWRQLENRVLSQKTDSRQDLDFASKSVKK